MEHNQNLPASKQDLVELFQNLNIKADNINQVWMFQDLSLIERLVTKRTISKFQRKVMENDLQVATDLRQAYHELVKFGMLEALETKLNSANFKLRVSESTSMIEYSTGALETLRDYLGKAIVNSLTKSEPLLKALEAQKSNPYYNVAKDNIDKIFTTSLTTMGNVMAIHTVHYETAVKEILKVKDVQNS